VQRGLDAHLARQVAEQFTAHDALGAHARDEIGITQELRAQPLQAAAASAAAFATGAALPLLVIFVAPLPKLTMTVIAISLIALALLGASAARAGGAHVLRGAVRVVFWSALAMAATAGIGKLFGV
jgi:VIT1/CCC1 family predicted Fe2+/Mn2+ transporter